MQTARYYRSQAELARRLAEQLTSSDDRATLEKMAVAFDDLAKDIEGRGAPARDPGALPQAGRPR